MTHTGLWAAFYLQHTAVGSGAMNNLESVANGAETFLTIRILIFSVGNGATNVHPWFWQRRNKPSTMLTTALWCLTIKVLLTFNIIFLSTFPAFFVVFLLSVLHVYIISYIVCLCKLKGGRTGLAALQREWGYSSLSQRRDEFHSRVGIRFWIANSRTIWSVTGGFLS
jgi:hypothetical protein